jgi:hypothetical protein
MLSARRQRWPRYAAAADAAVCVLLRRVSAARAATLLSVIMALSQAVLRVDKKVEEHFLEPAVEHAEALSQAVTRHHLGRLDPLFARTWGQAAPQDHDTMERPAAGAGGQRVSGGL